MADEKDKKAKRTTAKAGETGEQKPKRTRSAGTRKAAATKDKKPARAKAEPKGKPETRADDREKAAPKPRQRTTRSGTTARAKEKEAADRQADQPVAKEETAKAPARKPAARRKEPRPAPAAPVVMARARYVRSSARKARLVIEHVRGKPIGEARALLRHSPRGVARDLERLLNSAVANAENNHDLVGDDLYVKEIYADEGPTLKRFRARAQGRAYRIRKRTSHLTVALTPKE
jgi:ribosomal protein L22